MVSVFKWNLALVVLRRVGSSHPRKEETVEARVTSPSARAALVKVEVRRDEMTVKGVIPPRVGYAVIPTERSGGENPMNEVRLVQRRRGFRGRAKRSL